MKPWMRPYLFSIGLLLGGLLLFSLISSALYAWNWIDANAYRLLNTLFGYLSFGCSGICFGAMIEKKALLQALFMGILFTPVSYTHLDVYKRQLHVSAKAALPLPGCFTNKKTAQSSVRFIH